MEKERMKQYTIYHLHSDYSSCVTNIDSATKIDMYIKKAAELGMKAMAFSEHGSVLNWYEKKSKIEKFGMKYIHAIECYITMSIGNDENGEPIKVRDNYHCVLLAKNYEGFKEINRLTSRSFNRDDGHYYYTPRILMDDIINTSDNIMVTSACLGGTLNKGTDEAKEKFLNFFINNPNRTFLEIQHHNVKEQIEYNRYLYELSKKYGLNLITGTDTHSLNKELAEARIILQRARGASFEGEDDWDLTFKTYDELVESYKKQGSLPMEVVLDAINNTNVMADMVEEFELDTTPKYPQLYENSEETFRNKIYKAIDEHPYALKNHTKEELIERVEHEIDGFNQSKAIDFMLFQAFLREWEHENGVYVGPGRGSCFTKDALVACKDGSKTIDKVSVGDYVLSSDSEFHKVYDKKEYDVEEDLIEYEHEYQNHDYKNICTSDHRILVFHGNGKDDYIPASELKVGDLLCCPVTNKDGITISYASVTKIIVHKNTKAHVYDISVKDSENFLVNGMIVHNCTGSEVSYLLGITDMDSLRFDLNFWRFINPGRVSNCD